MRIHHHLSSILTDNEKAAYRVWQGKQERKGAPVLCWGMYRWVAPAAAIARRKEFLQWRKENPTPRAVRPEWCTRTFWDSFRNYQRNYRADITIEEYAARRRGEPYRRPKHLADPGGSCLKRTPQEILAKFAARGQLKP